MKTIELNQMTLETVVGGRRATNVRQSNFSSISLKNMKIDADTKGVLNTGGFVIAVTQTNNK